ncbi:MAG: helix-turn-helix transcriptional regulator [Micromonosporaceae bacterium]
MHSETDTVDAAVCLVLLNRPYATRAELAPVVAVPEREVTHALNRLHADGLVQVVASDPDRYAARVAPDTAAEMLTRRAALRQRGNVAPAALRALPPRAADAPEVLTGRDEIRGAVAALQRGARREVLGVDRPPYVDNPAQDPIEREQLHNGVSYRVVYERTALSVPGRLDVITELVELGEQARTAPSVPMKMMIVDRSAAVIPLQVSEHTVELSLLVRHSSLLNALTRVFADLWNTAVSFGAGATPPESTPTNEERRILALLASGATDETIGRLMGVSPRTAHRRVRDLSYKLGVETRFQVGVQAVRMGWL